LIALAAIIVLALAASAELIDFTARGGDQYPFESDFEPLGVSYQQALANYITEALGGVISAAEYPEGGEGRIVAQ
jgi:5'-nucleotidase/UDP-sugar diphosphatase